MNSPIPPMPSNFSFRYVMWYLWCNAITILMIAQSAFSALTLDPTLVSHNTFHWILIGNSVLTATIAIAKKNNPPGPPPTKSPSAPVSMSSTNDEEKLS
jgi:hypothetical protein